MVGTESGGMEEVGLAVFADGQAMVSVDRRVPNTLLADHEFTSVEDAATRILPQVLTLRETADGVRSFTELYALACNRYGWDVEADSFWDERAPQSVIGKERAGKPLKKPKGFIRRVEGTQTQEGPVS
jgi:hypothetical protein